LLNHWLEENLLHPSPDAADRYVATLSRDARPATVAARLAGAKALYRALRWCRATEADPFADVRAPRDPTPRHERRYPYSDADVAALLEVAEGGDRALILLCAHGGLRIAEALSLCWPEVDLPRGLLRVTAGKGRKARTVRLSASLVAALRAIRPADNQGPVIATTDGVPYADPTVPRRRLRLLCARAGITYMSFHSLRHTAGTRLARESGNLQLVAAHLGHADVSTAAIYAKWSDESLRKAVQDW
jgi:integrase/recombinase XerC